jgi:hypothetical protein
MPEDIILEDKTDLALSDKFCRIIDLAEIVSKHTDAPCRPLISHRQHLEQCSLARPALSENSQDLILVDLETDPFQLIPFGLFLLCTAATLTGSTCPVIRLLKAFHFNADGFFVSSSRH